MTDHAARRAARNRHPSAAGWCGDLGRFTEHMTVVFAREGRPHPRVSAAVQSARGVSGETVQQFSERLGVSPIRLERLESGDSGVADVSSAVQMAAPWIDWAAVRESDQDS